MMAEWQLKLANALTQGDVEALPEVLLLLAALIGCSVFGLVQFFTMLGTRWGDKSPAGKSLLLSFVVHAVIMLAWSTAIALRPLPATLAMPANEVSIPIQELREDVEDQFPSPEAQAWQKLTDQPELDVGRVERPLDAPAEVVEVPRMDVEASAPADDPNDLADLSVQPNETVSPEQQPSPAELAAKATAVPVTEEVEVAAAEARQEAGAGVPAPARTSPRMADPANLDEEIPKTRGSETAAALPQPDDLRMSMPLDSATDAEEAPVLAGQSSETVRKGAAPTPSSAADADFKPDGQTDAVGKTSATGRTTKFDRMKSPRPGPESPDVGLPSRTPGEVSSLKNPNSARLSSPSSRSLTDLSGTPSPSLAPAVSPNLPNRSPATYKLRQLEKRRGSALKNGGSLESERAVENSLKWLAQVQEREGYWDADKYGAGVNQNDPTGKRTRDRNGREQLLVRTNDGIHADTGVTGLALLAFMGAGYTATEGEYSKNVDLGLNWLVQQQADDGYLGGGALAFDKMYCHAIATFALGEACGIPDESAPEPALRQALRKAVDYIVSHQGKDGGWRYREGQDGDMSMFGWQLMALKSADIAGVKVQAAVWNRMVSFLKARSQGESSGLASYFPNEPTPTPTMTAEALFCKQMIGIHRSNPACQEAVAYLQKNLPKITAYDEYYWYYGTLAMFQHGGEPWDEWNNAQRDLLVRLQQTNGKFAGSWDPKGKWAGIGGRIYSTAVSTLCLEVYYRYLPLYQSTQE